MIKHILLPMDLAEPSDSIIKNAVFLCQKTHSKLTLLHIFRLPQPIPMHSPATGDTPVYPIDHYMDGEALTNEKSRINKNVGKLKKRIPALEEIETEVITSTGLVVEQISEFAAERQVDLIVMETSGASGIKGIFVGTHSEETTRKAPCPVLIFPEGHTTISIQKICIAVDDTIKDYSSKLMILKDIAILYSADVHIIHIEDKPDIAIKNQLEKTLRKIFSGVDFTFNIIKSDDVEESIFKFTENQHTDLLALVYHKQNIFNRLMKKSVTTNVAYHTDIPLLVLK